ncbi:MobA/MobL family protein, partial [Ruegeria lacuscaerulensis]|uniref:MobA/MobL family protein n=1 Tax=Ruegeria lacuscaerulensis TaxID=55218 RepID=UPI001480830F
AIHEPNKEGDQRNHHAHILTTTRKIKGGELTGKTRELDERKSGAIEEVRTAWEELANRHLERSQRHERVDRRSFERQGKEKAPSVHLGPSATAMERRGELSERGNLNRLVAGLNRQFDAARTYLTDIARSIRERAEALTREKETARLEKREKYREALAGAGNLDQQMQERRLARELERRREQRRKQQHKAPSRPRTQGPSFER